MSLHSIPPLIALTHAPDVPIGAAELASVGAALQKQVTRDFAPIWNQPATIAAFPAEAAVPMGYWPIVIMRKLADPNALGYHLDPHHQPISFVEYTHDWAVTASHELLEMLADPWGSRLVVCDDPRPGKNDRVRVLVEACDPCEAFTYTVDGIRMSDFLMPAYYGPKRWHFKSAPPAGAGHYSFTGALAAPLSVAKGGYLSYVDSTGHWWQTTWFSGAQPSVRELGRKSDDDARTPRAWIDAQATVAARKKIGSAK